MSRQPKANDLTQTETDILTDLLDGSTQLLAVLDEGLEFYPRTVLAEKFSMLGTELVRVGTSLLVSEAPIDAD